MILIIDASVAVKWGVTETGADKARALLQRDARIIAPDILASEVASALWRKELRGDLNEAERRLALEASLSGYDEFVPCVPLASRVLEIAVSLKHSVYDCFYLALAEARDGVLVSSDKRLLTRLSEAGWAGSFEAL